MLGTMQDYPLTIGMLFRHGATVHGGSEVVTFEGDGSRRASFAEVAGRVERLAAALTPPRHRTGRPGRHVRVEHPGAPRGLLRGPRHRRGAAHAQHPAVPRAADVRDQPRRRPARPRRRRPDPAARQGRGRAHDRRALHRDRRRRHGRARRGRAERRDPALPRAPRRRGARVRVARGRRARRGGDVLHERHDREPEGRRLHAPFDVPALVRRREPAPHRRPHAHPADRPHVPRQRVGPAVRGLVHRGRLRAPREVPPGRAAGAPHQAERPTFSGAVPTIWADVLRYAHAHPGAVDLSSMRHDRVRRIRRAAER